MPTWVRGEERAEVVAPFPQPLAITALGNSGSTGKSGVEGEVVHFPTLAALVAAPPGSLAGKIVFLSHAMARSQDGSSYGAFNAVRLDGPGIAASKGAIAAIVQSLGTDHHRLPHAGRTDFEASIKPIPAAALSIPDAETLERLLARGPVRLRLLLTPRNIGPQKSGNVIADLPGSDPTLPPIVIACHLDSWDLGTGAIDNAAGCGIITAAAKALMDTPRKRTIRLLWAGAEEMGSWGGKAYADANRDTLHALAMESDFGADRVWRADIALPASASALAERIAARLLPLGIARGPDQSYGGSDVRPIIAAQKLGVIGLRQDGNCYFDLHHTADDTLDKVDPAQLRQNVAAWTAVLAELASHEGELSFRDK
jgi:Zn-dependent M28 family amino/carboxypeptidase